MATVHAARIRELAELDTEILSADQVQWSSSSVVIPDPPGPVQIDFQALAPPASAPEFDLSTLDEWSFITQPNLLAELASDLNFDWLPFESNAFDM